MLTATPGAQASLAQAEFVAVSNCSTACLPYMQQALPTLKSESCVNRKAAERAKLRANAEDDADRVATLAARQQAALHTLLNCPVPAPVQLQPAAVEAGPAEESGTAALLERLLSSSLPTKPRPPPSATPPPVAAASLGTPNVTAGMSELPSASGLSPSATRASQAGQSQSHT